ncbi:hypothetical protein RSOLAG1IB_12603 [Rhizoctonia solani AG-1 IB]|uniref:Uncharacterized protein n=1 Tax=Thanatephorus cucumeris (strain AG1-IB / isolate 7/3/14) TaxID=1108050 RepID=A0A0B7G1F1_THACB|nr:hypothetical protein RSOLAG1IB_12603 [Rhizoctonia solani AG-1 IB]
MKGWIASTERKYVWVIGFKCYQSDIAAWVVSSKYRSSHSLECLSGLVPSPVSPFSLLSLMQMSLAYVPFQLNHRPIEDAHTFVYVSAAAILSHVIGSEHAAKDSMRVNSDTLIEVCSKARALQRTVDVHILGSYCIDSLFFYSSPHVIAELRVLTPQPTAPPIL